MIMMTMVNNNNEMNSHWQLTLLSSMLPRMVSLHAININMCYQQASGLQRNLCYMSLQVRLVSWSLTSLFSTNTASSETKGQGWRVILIQW